ncbi:MAG: PIN domain-containing protein [Acidobacteria bacterium]|nr:PIN domain-containing protein [Acidobacteriota bacterium]
MTGGVLADTGPLYALADPSDQFHERAHQELAELTKRRKLVMIPFTALMEAHNLIGRRLGNRYALTWLEEIRSGATMLNPEYTDYLAALEKLKAYPDQDISLADATVAALSERLSLPVWTFDHHFDTMRAAIWRPAR